MKKYLLSIHGDYQTKQICKEIATVLTPIVDSPHLKFSLKQHQLLFCFESDVEQSELKSYIEGSLFGLYEYFIMSVVDDNLSVSMDSETVGHLFDTSNESSNPDMVIDMSKELKGENDPSIEELENEYLRDFLNEIKSKIRQPSLDEILDKINRKGLQSITPFEKEILDNYGK